MNKAQTVEQWNITAESIQQKLEDLVAPTSDGKYRFIDHFVILPEEPYSKTHNCFVAWHWEQTETNSSKSEKK
jgi:hypothetical protein